MSHLVIPVLVETKQIPTSIIIYFLSYLFSPSTGSVLLGDVVWHTERQTEILQNVFGCCGRMRGGGCEQKQLKLAWPAC